MKKISLIISLLSIVFITKSQVNLEMELGGSNFLGATINTSIDIPITLEKEQYITPKIGLGYLLPSWDVPTAILHCGATFKSKRMGVGVDVSNFIDSPLNQNEDNNLRSFVDLILYPNLSYDIIKKPRFYLRTSLGSYFAFSKHGSFGVTEEQKLEFEGDVIVGGGISLGYKFGSKE